jgi:hypothetical protein
VISTNGKAVISTHGKAVISTPGACLSRPLTLISSSRSSLLQKDTGPRKSLLRKGKEVRIAGVRIRPTVLAWQGAPQSIRRTSGFSSPAGSRQTRERCIYARRYIHVLSVSLDHTSSDRQYGIRPGSPAGAASLRSRASRTAGTGPPVNPCQLVKQLARVHPEPPLGSGPARYSLHWQAVDRQDTAFTGRLWTGKIQPSLAGCGQARYSLHWQAVDRQDTAFTGRLWTGKIQPSLAGCGQAGYSLHWLLLPFRRGIGALSFRRRVRPGVAD